MGTILGARTALSAACCSTSCLNRAAFLGDLAEISLIAYTSDASPDRASNTWPWPPLPTLRPSVHFPICRSARCAIVIILPRPGTDLRPPNDCRINCKTASHGDGDRGTPPAPHCRRTCGQRAAVERGLL